MDFNSDQLWALWGVVLSLVFAYVPYAKDWYDSLDSRWKPVIMAVGLLLLTAGKLFIGCRWDFACVQASAGEYVNIWFYALLANIATYQIAVKQVKQAELEAEYYAEPQ